MTSKEKILSRIKAIDLPAKEMPTIPVFQGLAHDKISFFVEMLENLGVRVLRGNAFAELKHTLAQTGYGAQEVFSNIPFLADVTDAQPQQPQQLKLSVLAGELGVAENGAIWVNGAALPQRALTAIGENLMICLSLQKIVWNMHEAYTYIQPRSTGYGVFISGPSKTADIEQALVKGAHGARSLTVFLY